MALLTRSFRRVAMLLAFGAGLSMPAFADDGLQLHEQEIEAGLLYNFLKYIEWPPASVHAASSVAVCVFGNDPFDGYLRPMAGRSVNRRTITVRDIHDPRDAADCDLIFVNAAEKARWPQLLKFLDGRNILTVSDFDEFASSGGMIEFGRKDDHINISLNIDAVTAAKLHVEDRLLKLVTIMHAPPREGR